MKLPSQKPIGPQPPHVTKVDTVVSEKPVSGPPNAAWVSRPVVR